MGELQDLQPRCHYDRRYPCSHGCLVPLPDHRLQSIRGGFAEGLDDTGTQLLEDEVEDAAKMLVGDIDLSGETDGNGEAQ